MKFSLRLILKTLLAAGFLSCASKNHLTNEFREALALSNPQVTSGRTVVVILIDGLPASTLRAELRKSRLPHIRKYFQTSKNGIFSANGVYTARAAFPSLTFPGIGSLLMERPIDQTGIYGNVIFNENERLDFESPLNYPMLNRLFEGQNIFSRLKSLGLKSISVDYSFDANADAHMERNDAQAALAIQNRDYAFVDQKLISSLTHLLKNTNHKFWPDFVFIHLIGLDLASHDHGAHSVKAHRYLKFLDQKLESLFSLLEKAEIAKQRKVSALLTADHGFDRNITRIFDLEKIISHVEPRMKILNEGRFLGLYFPEDWEPDKIEILMDELSKNPLIDIVGSRQGSKVVIHSNSSSRKLTSTIAYQFAVCKRGNFQISISGGEFTCPEKLEKSVNQLYYPFFLRNISHYFRTPNSPDAIVISRPGVSFLKGVYKGANGVANGSSNRGAHGGPTLEETEVPLLMHQCQLPDPLETPELSQLLQFLFE
jgi:hypothetical protein